MIMIYDDILRMNVPSLDNFLIFPLFLIIWECLTHLPLSQKDGTLCLTLDHWNKKTHVDKNQTETDLCLWHMLQTRSDHWNMVWLKKRCQWAQHLLVILWSEAAKAAKGIRELPGCKWNGLPGVPPPVPFHVSFLSIWAICLWFMWMKSGNLMQF